MSIRNGIWLCAVCSDLADKDVVAHTVPVLVQWRASAEESAFARLRRALETPTLEAMLSCSDRIAVDRHLDEAFDALAGAMWSSRLTWRHVDDVAIERANRALRDAEHVGVASSRTVFLRAACLFGRGFPDKSLELLDAASDPKGFVHTLMRAICLDALGERRKSLDLLELLSKDATAPPAVFYNIGRAHLHLGNPGEAESSLQKAVSMDPKYAEAFDLLGHLAYDRRDFAEAARLTAKACEIANRDAEFVTHYALALVDLGDYSTASAALLPFVQGPAPPVEVLQLLGRIAGELGNLSVAESLLRQVLRRDPVHSVALHNLGMVFLYSGRFEEAITTFEAAQLAGYSEPEDIPGRVRKLRDEVSQLNPKGAS